MRRNRDLRKMSITTLRDIAKGQMFTLAALMEREETETERYEKLRQEFILVKQLIEYKESLKKNKKFKKY